MDAFRIRPISEADVDAIITAAGGRRAHPDADRRNQRGSDYLLVETLLELKCLEDEGLTKPERQTKLATLFREHEKDRPVVVLDRAGLPPESQHRYDRILEGPIKSAIAKARKQLKQSRREHASATASVLFVINNGYTALDHEALLRMVAHRVRNDTQEIDGIVVAGCYFCSDTFDSYFLWPIDYVPINLGRPFGSFERLKQEWDAFAERFMTLVVQGEVSPQSVRGPVVDTHFEVDGVTYIKPVPPMGLNSEFFSRGRPRQNSSGITSCPPVGICFPDLSREEWTRVRETLGEDEAPFNNYDTWQAERLAAEASGEQLRPFVPIAVTCDQWQEWSERENLAKSPSSLFDYAAAAFDARVREILASARERLPTSIVPSRYILAMTEEIGQDVANDVSHIAVVTERVHSDPLVREVVVNARLFHEYAITVAAAYAVVERIDSVLWQKDLTYSWT